MLEIQSWFDNKDQLAATDIHGQISATERKGGDTPEGSRVGVHRAAPLGHGANRFTESNREGAVVGVSIQMEHPPEIEGSSIYRVPFVRVSCQSEPVESSSTEPNCKRRKAVGPTTLPCHPLPHRSHCLTRRLSVAEEYEGTAPQPNSRAGCELSGGA